MSPNKLSPFKEGEMEIGGLLIVSSPESVDFEGNVSFKFPLSKADEKRLKALQDFVGEMLASQDTSEVSASSTTPPSPKTVSKKSIKKEKVNDNATKEATMSTKPNPFA